MQRFCHLIFDNKINMLTKGLERIIDGNLLTCDIFSRSLKCIYFLCFALLNHVGNYEIRPHRIKRQKRY